MPFGNPVVGQEELIRDAIRSENYVSGSTGWRIAKNGDAEFNEGTFRSELNVTAPDGSFVRIGPNASHADILLQPGNVTGATWNPARISADGEDQGGGDYQSSLTISSPFFDDTIDPIAIITLGGPAALAGNQSFIDLSADTVNIGGATTSGGFVSLFGGFVTLGLNDTSITHLNGRFEKPLARGSGSASQAGLARNTSHKVAINTDDIDTDAGFDLANNRYVFPRLGYWRVSYDITMDSFTTPSGTPYAEAWVDLNGVGGNKYAREATPINVASDTVALSGSEIIEATALTDYVELFGRYTNGTAGTTMQILAGALFPTLTVEYVG